MSFNETIMNNLLNLGDLPLDAKFVYTLGLLGVVFIIYKYGSRLIDRTRDRLEFEAHAVNGIRLLLRVGAIMVGSFIVLIIWELPSEWFVGSSALIGAFLGFGSSQTINNVVAGFYVLVTQPFKVKDYVKIGDLEGQVEEISINYTILYTPTFNILKVPNTQVINSRIMNLTHEGFIKYTFHVSFSHDYTNKMLLDKCIQPAMEKFHDKHGDLQLRTPEAYLESADRLGKSFLIRIFIPKGEAKTLHTLQPELLDMIMENWYTLKSS